MKLFSIKTISVVGFVLLGLLLFWGSILFLNKGASLQTSSLSAIGVITNVKETEICGRYGCNRYHILTIKYSNLEKQTFESGLSVNADSSLKKGDQVSIWYAKNSPQYISFDRGEPETVAGLVFLALAVVSIFYSIYTFKKPKQYLSK